MRWAWVVAFGGFGLAVGVASGLAALPWWVEPAAWLAGFLVWAASLAWRVPSPLGTAVAGGSAAGLAWGGVLTAFPTGDPWQGLLAQGLVGGFLAGGLTGLVATGIQAIGAWRASSVPGGRGK